MSKHQKNNGSFFNSPSATAALFYNHNQQCYDYLTTLLNNNDNAVPTTYPSEIYSQLCAVENIQKLGIDDRYFRIEIDNTLDNIYRLWMQKDEEIYLDVNCCALGFRLLRLEGYDVSSDVLAHVSEEEYFFNSLEVWTSSFLKQQLLTDAIKDSKLHEEVSHALRYRYDSLNFLEMRWEIEQQKTNSVQLLKTSYSLNYNNSELLTLAIQQYNMCQLLYQKEYQNLERYVKVCRFEELNFARVMLLNCYYTTSAILVAPELTDARISTIKNCILVTVVDDFFDIAGSKEELENLVQLVQRWEETSTIGYRSEQVKIIFSALEGMIKELDAIAFKHHGRSVEHQLVKIWDELLKSMMKEAAWAGENAIPSLDEYMENAYISFALGPICHITTYFLGITLPEEIMLGPQVHKLFKHVSLVGRLFNDLRSFKREREQGKYNSISLRVLHSQGNMTEEEAIEGAKRDIEMYSKELLLLTVQKEENPLPKPFRELFWNFSNSLHYFYVDNDGYSNPKNKMASDAKIAYLALQVDSRYSVKSGYYKYLEFHMKGPKEGDQPSPSNLVLSRKDWNNFWQMNIPNTIRFFIWKSFHKGIPVLEASNFCLKMNLNYPRHCLRKETPSSLFRLWRRRKRTYWLIFGSLLYGIFGKPGIQKSFNQIPEQYTSRHALQNRKEFDDAQS
ncbi:ent-kaurene synthase-like 2 [Mercurialis annua]|uniref:ent-kaurene synthase-like 2 n=1 Tax=Mercurialis annua TaxID=3986 RepID=UPI002160C2CF|nr:ent-kaurene synthase-like 2 [Mercurialis annua]